MPEPFIFHCAKTGEGERWRVGFDCGSMVFYQDFYIVVRTPPPNQMDWMTLFVKSLIPAMQRALAGMTHHYALPAIQREAREQSLRCTYEVRPEEG